MVSQNIRKEILTTGRLSFTFYFNHSWPPHCGLQSCHAALDIPAKADHAAAAVAGLYLDRGFVDEFHK